MLSRRGFPVRFFGRFFASFPRPAEHHLAVIKLLAGACGDVGGHHLPPLHRSRRFPTDRIRSHPVPRASPEVEPVSYGLTDLNRSAQARATITTDRPVGPRL